MLRRDLISLLPASLLAAPAPKTVVLTFDDAVKSHRTFVGPLLKELGFRATFFVSHRWMPDTANFMSWSDIADLHNMGFEIGNHSWTHADFSTPRNAARLEAEIALVEYELSRVKVPKPTSFAWCGNTFGPEAIDVLKRCGIKLARRGGSPEVEYGKVVVGPYLDVKKHHPLLIPTTGDNYPDGTFENFRNVVATAKDGHIAVLQFHGVPDIAHPWVHTPPDLFRRYMDYLKQEGFTTLALRDLEPHFDLSHPPADPLLQSRYRPPKDGRLVLPIEVEQTRKDEPYWRSVMAEHAYSPAEVSLVTARQESAAPQPPTTTGLRIRPYPGGRHPRIGFLEGEIAPMRGTKASVFLPWNGGGYVVVDVPEAIFANKQLLFLAHTHIPSVWDDQNIVIPNQDWIRDSNGTLRSEWTLPNKVRFGAKVASTGDAIAMELWLTNGSDQPLTGLRTQVCVMLKGAPGFTAQTSDNKVFATPRASVRSADGKHSIHTEWSGAGRIWGNPRCPCMHSDPVLPDCGPGETVRQTGRLWFETRS
ncbi:MAG: polysaccharide deacetylase family protein [Bryobacteraceae bacterium]